MFWYCISFAYLPFKALTLLCNEADIFVGTFTSSPVIPAATHHYQRPSNAGSVLSRASMTASLPNPVRMREKRSHKPRPASVASSMPSSLSGELAKSSRSRSSDRTGRGRVVPQNLHTNHQCQISQVMKLNYYIFLHLSVWIYHIFMHITYIMCIMCTC